VEYDEGDLLQANPNHIGNGWDVEPNGEVEDSDAERDDVETLVVGMARTDLANHSDPG